MHILASINSATKLFGLFEKDDYGWWLRFYYIVYHYAIQRIADIKNHLDNNNKAVVTKSIQSEIDELMNNGGKILTCSHFRNCMMHYDLYDKNGIFMISPEYLNLNTPLFGLVESCYAGITYMQLKSEIIKRLNETSMVLSKWLNITLNNLSKL